MNDDELKPMTDHDVVPAARDASPEPASPVKDAGPDGSAAVATPTLPTSVADAKRQARDGADHLSRRATDKAMTFADQGKERATGALEELSRMLTDAAGQVDAKLGDQYGHYARSAAGTVQGFADQLRDKKVDDIVDDARVLVRKSPGVAIGAAAAVGFVVARLISAGIDQRDA